MSKVDAEHIDGVFSPDIPDQEMAQNRWWKSALRWSEDTALVQ